jgi:hypothetical protein
MRYPSLKRTALLENYKSSDINLVVGISLYGQFYEIPEYLFSRRMHAKASSWDKNNEEVLKAFWDPSKKELNLQLSRSVYEYYKAITRSPIRLNEKLKLYLYMLRRASWQKREIYSEIVDYFGLNYRSE